MTKRTQSKSLVRLHNIESLHFSIFLKASEVELTALKWFLNLTYPLKFLRYFFIVKLCLTITLCTITLLSIVVKCVLQFFKVLVISKASLSVITIESGCTCQWRGNKVYDLEFTCQPLSWPDSIVYCCKSSVAGDE